MSATTSPSSISVLLEAIEIPDSAYEKAKARYEDIGEWLCRPESSVRAFDPSISPQGSFYLGTVTRPPHADGEYDLDLSVKLQRGITKSSHTQKQLKELLGAELEAYRKARGIEQSLDEKRRCWRLQYKDQISFHIDVVPCIPEDNRRRVMIKEAMLFHHADEMLADAVARLTVSITDYEHSDYEVVCHDWNVSNPQGYGRWFASRVRLATQAIRDRLLMEKRATVEDLPIYKLKAPLQICVQLLKQHRNIMFQDDPDSQPISIIITTLAAQAYKGQEDLTEALLHIVDTMPHYIRAESPYVPNPVNPPSENAPGEDFSDKWDTPEGQALDLKGNFYRWLEQARVDFHYLADTQDPVHLEKRVKEALGLSLNRNLLLERLGLAAAPITPAIVVPTQRIEHAFRPWAAE